MEDGSSDGTHSPTYWKRITWEDSKKYVLVNEKDEYKYNDSERVSKFTIYEIDTMLSLIESNKTPRYTGEWNRTRNMSGFTMSVIPLDSFDSWFKWYHATKVDEYVIEFKTKYEKYINKLSYFVSNSNSIDEK